MKAHSGRCLHTNLWNVFLCDDRFECHTKTIPTHGRTNMYCHTTHLGLLFLRLSFSFFELQACTFFSWWADFLVFVFFLSYLWIWKKQSTSLEFEMKEYKVLNKKQQPQYKVQSLGVQCLATFCTLLFKTKLQIACLASCTNNCKVAASLHWCFPFIYQSAHSVLHTVTFHTCRTFYP